MTYMFTNMEQRYAEWCYAPSVQSCVPEGIHLVGSLHTWLICILVILNNN